MPLTIFGKLEYNLTALTVESAQVAAVTWAVDKNVDDGIQDAW